MDAYFFLTLGFIVGGLSATGVLVLGAILLRRPEDDDDLQ